MKEGLTLKKVPEEEKISEWVFLTPNCPGIDPDPVSGIRIGIKNKLGSQDRDRDGDPAGAW